MSKSYRISLPNPPVRGKVVLEPSKSISNRVLIIQSLCKDTFTIHRLSTSDDTGVLKKMLSSDRQVLYSGHAGSSYRFMVARACFMDKEITLDASDQLRRRPVGPLVKALQSLGADISYLGREGFPPLLIKPSKDFGRKTHEIHMPSGISSQYVSALLLIAPRLPEGLILNLVHDPVSTPYIRMTLDVMTWFGIKYSWEGNKIIVSPGEYIARDFTVEGDWSAASYFYSIAALAPAAEVNMEGLSENSLQGDAIVSDLYKLFGVETIFHSNGISIHKNEGNKIQDEFQFDFSKNPDLAQTIMGTLAGKGIKGVLSGLKTLRIKETDRIAAMQTELAKVKVSLEVRESDDNVSVTMHGKAKWKDKAKFNTYGDHRMAMALTPLACLHPVMIRDPGVVRKSYPQFWKDASAIGFQIDVV